MNNFVCVLSSDIVCTDKEFFTTCVALYFKQ